VTDTKTDGHNDLLILLRSKYQNHLYDSEFQDKFENGGLPGHVDLPRIKEGSYGGAFWSAFLPCPKNVTDFSNEAYAWSMCCVVLYSYLLTSRSDQGYT
jgi:membrane dipeptidase